MTHKQHCILNCKEYLQNRGLMEIYDGTAFESYYRKHNGANANPYTFGMKAGDYIIHNSKTAVI